MKKIVSLILIICSMSACYRDIPNNKGDLDLGVKEGDYMSKSTEVIKFKNKTFAFYCKDIDYSKLNVLMMNNGVADDVIKPVTKNDGQEEDVIHYRSFPSAVVYNDQLYVFYKGHEDHSKIEYVRIIPDGNDFTITEPQVIQGTQEFDQDEEVENKFYIVAPVVHRGQLKIYFCEDESIWEHVMDDIEDTNTATTTKIGRAEDQEVHKGAVSATVINGRVVIGYSHREEYSMFGWLPPAIFHNAAWVTWNGESVESENYPIIEKQNGFLSDFPPKFFYDEVNRRLFLFAKINLQHESFGQSENQFMVYHCPMDIEIPDEEEDEDEDEDQEGKSRISYNDEDEDEDEDDDNIISVEPIQVIQDPLIFPWDPDNITGTESEIKMRFGLSFFRDGNVLKIFATKGNKNISMMQKFPLVDTKRKLEFGVFFKELGDPSIPEENWSSATK